MVLSTSLQTLSQSNPFGNHLEALYQERSLVTYTAGLTIPLQSQHLHIICRGIVQLHTIHADGNETIVGLCGPTMAFGSSLTHLHPYWATALTDTDLLPLSLSEIEASPALAAGLFPQLVRRLQQSEAWLAFAGKRLVTDRLRSLILQLAQDFGTRGSRSAQAAADHASSGVWSGRDPGCKANHPVNPPSAGDYHRHHSGNRHTSATRL